MRSVIFGDSPTKSTKAAKANKRAKSPKRARLAKFGLSRRWMAAITVLIAVGALGGVAGHLIVSGRLSTAYDNFLNDTLRVSGDLGLAVGDVLVEGRYRTTRSDLARSLSVERGDPILAVDLSAAQKRIEDLAWIKSARLERRLPDTLFVSIVERKPVALWQRKGKLYVIDRDGTVVLRDDKRAFANLPIVIGKGAPERAHAFLGLLESEPELRRKVRALTWVGDRRWTVRLEKGVDVQLPENNPAAAWAHLAKMERDHGVLKRDVVTVDLRLPNQLVVRVAPARAARMREPGKDT